MFAVKKKGSVDGNTQRLIVDCRQSNSLMRRPPTTRLATSAGLASLDFSTEALAEQGYEHLDIDPLTSGLDTGDVGDCFYNFVVPNACSWFSTGDIVDLEDMRRWNMVDHYIYDEDSGITTPFCLVNVFTSAFGVCLWDGVGPFISHKRLLVTSVCWLLINLRKF